MTFYHSFKSLISRSTFLLHHIWYWVFRDGMSSAVRVASVVNELIYKPLINLRVSNNQFEWPKLPHKPHITSTNIFLKQFYCQTNELLFSFVKRQQKIENVHLMCKDGACALVVHRSERSHRQMKKKN